MGVDISSIGTYNHWSPIADYTTTTLAKLSDQLTVPTGRTLVTKASYYTGGINPILITESNDENSKLEKLLLYYLEKDELLIKELEAQTANDELPIKAKVSQSLVDTLKELTLQTVIDILLLIKNQPDGLTALPTTLSNPKIVALINLINRHNTAELTPEAARNIVLKSIIAASLDEKNMRLSYSPIDGVMKKFQNILKTIVDDGARNRSLDDGGLSIARMQYTNSVGKKDVGIMANGLKAFFALTHYLNKHKSDPDFVSSRRYFLTKFTINGNEDYFSSISDQLLELVTIDALLEALKQYAPEAVAKGKTLTMKNDNASLLISALVSLATDNAKELALAKMNASIDLACMHLFLVVMGYSPKEIIQYTTSPAFLKLADTLNTSKISQSISVRKAIDKIIAEEPELIPDMAQIRHLYNCAQEMSKVAKIASINQGVKVDELEMDDYARSVKSVIASQLENLQFEFEVDNNGQLKLIVPGKVDTEHDKSTTISELVLFKNNIESNELVQRHIQKFDRLNQLNQLYKYLDSSLTIDLVRYYQDPQYKEFIIDLYDLIKCNFNVLDCISELTHFNKMLEAFIVSEKTLKQLNSRARVILDEALKAYSYRRIDNYNIETEEDYQGILRSKRVKVFDKFDFNLSILRKASSFYDDFILSEWIKEFGSNFTISYLDNDGKEHTLELKTNEDVLKFTHFMAYELIPLLKQLYPDNKFLLYIKPDFRKLLRKSTELYLPKYAFKFNIDHLTTYADQNKAFYVNLGFAELGQKTLAGIGLEVTQGQDLRLGELFYLYDKLVSASSIGQGSLNRAFETYLAQSIAAGQETIAKLLGTIIREHDLGIRSDIIFDPLIFTIYCYANQIRRTLKGVAKYDYDKQTELSSELNISDKYLFNLDNVVKVNNDQFLLEKFLYGLNNGNIEYQIDELNQVVLTSKFDSNFRLSFLILDFSLQELALALQELTKDENIKNLLTEMVKAIDDSQTGLLQDYEGLATFKKIQNRLALLGVDVEITDDPNALGYISEGKIYLNPKKQALSTTTMHEMLHLVFGVMKADNFKAFEKFMNLIMRTDAAKTEYDTLSLTSEYGNLMDLDLQEEVFCRLMEAIISNDRQVGDVFTDGLLDLWFDIAEQLTPFINRTFGIDILPGSLMMFLNSPMSTLPQWNSSMFIRTKSDSTGYLTQRTKVIQSTKISAYIEDLVRNNALTKTEC